MLRLALFLSLLCLPALAQSAHRNWAKAACEDDLDSCRESCTIADGTSLDTQGRLARCSQTCQEQSERCLFKRFQARRDLNAPKPAPAQAVAVPVDPLPSRPPPSTAVSGAPSGATSVPPPASTASARSPLETDDVWSSLPTAAPPREAPAAFAGPTPAPAPSPAPVSPPPAPASALAPPAEDNVDALLDHHDGSAAHAVRSSPADAAPPAKTLPPPKKDLSKWDPDALK
jgi:hypothetical protein